MSKSDYQKAYGTTLKLRHKNKGKWSISVECGLYSKLKKQSTVINKARKEDY